MGEKIRDIKPIKIGKASLMVELNEGYTSDQGRLIHVQNKKFRYLITENDFYHLCSMILRAHCEFHYIKQNSSYYLRKNALVREHEGNDNIVIHSTRNPFQDLFDNLGNILDSKAINYRVLDISGNQLTLIVFIDCLNPFKEILMNQGFVFRSHPNSSDIFLYQMTPFELASNDEGLEVVIYCQLPCRSITDKTWIPLDRVIQKHIWNNCFRDNGFVWSDTISRYIYYLCRAIFEVLSFDRQTIEYLDCNKSVLENSYNIDLLSTVFFGYTILLKQKLLSSDYDSIIPDYYSFINY